MARRNLRIGAFPLLAAAMAGVATAADASNHAAATYSESIEPLLAKYCVNCHSGAKPKGKLALDRLHDSTAALDAPNVWRKTARRLRDKEMPPEDRPQPTDLERAALVTWMNAAVAHKNEATPSVAGRVTLRRLNRSEYNNTVRDLLHVDLQPADDFPADDLGYGFDTIGDVLSLPPLLMEQYLAAAQKIADTVIVEPKVTSVVKISAKQMTQHTDGHLTEDEQARELFSDGEVRAQVAVPADGYYRLRIRAYAEQAGSEPARMDILVDGKVIDSAHVLAVESPERPYSTNARLTAGEHTVAVAFVNDFYEPENPDPQKRDRNLFIEGLEVAGPIDLNRLSPLHRALVTSAPPDAEHSRFGERLVGRLASRAFRRRTGSTEMERLLQFVEMARRDGENFETGMKFVVQAVLVSPYFIYRVEHDPKSDDPAAAHPLDDFELATRLSYFLWSSMPDEELITLAGRGRLRDKDVLVEEVRRMLKHPKSRALAEDFAGQWLQLRSLAGMAPDPKQFPHVDERLRDAMVRETELFFDSVMRENRSVLDFLDAKYTFVDERLAKHYGIPGISGDAFRRVELDGTKRGGVLTQASILTLTSNPTRTSPVKRGKWVLENLLGTPPPPPPPSVPPFADNPEAALTGSLRQRLEQHRSSAECASCHARMDPIGFGLENYDAVGAWRAKDHNFTIDATGTFPTGESFAGPEELKQVLRQRKSDFTRCLASKLLVYAVGRGLEPYDEATVDKIVAKVSNSDYRAYDLVIAIVESDPFLKRGGLGDSP